MSRQRPRPRPPSRPRSFGIAAAVVFGLAAAIALPVGAQEPSPEAADVSAEALPDGFTPAMARRVNAVIEQVPPVRGLPDAEGVEYRVIDAEGFATELESLFREEYTDEFLAAEEAAYKRLGLLDADADLEQLILDLYDSQVLAYYDPRTTTFTLIGPVASVGALEEIVVAHEYGHALQDAVWDLEGRRIKDLSRSDAILAQQALVEGDATALMYEWAARELSFFELLRVSGQAITRQDSRKLERMPDILRRQLEFPYLDGFAFVNAIRARGDWAAVDDTWLAQPASTEQILHPELYPDEVPVTIQLPDIAASLGDGWAAAYEQTFGELQTHVWVADGRKPRSLFPILPAELPRAEAARGWGGDRLVSLDGPDGAWAVVWQTEWDSAADQREFGQAARDAMRDLPGAHSTTNTDIAGGLSSPVLVLVADSSRTLDAVNAALGLEA